MNNQASPQSIEQEAPNRTCGLVMPISAQPGCPPEHWVEVHTIIQDAISTLDNPKFDVRLVSDADDVGVIQKRIVQNIYNSDIVICDVSCKNSNVMFELGMRLAFDKPTVIIKDDQTDYSFDTGIIEHISYPRDLRFGKIVTFKKALAEKVFATYAASLSPNHSTFLKNFGTFHVAALAEEEVPAGQLVYDVLGEVRAELTRMRREISQISQPSNEELSKWSAFAQTEAGLRSKDAYEKILSSEYLRLADLYGKSPSAAEVAKRGLGGTVTIKRKVPLDGDK